MSFRPVCNENGICAVFFHNLRYVTMGPSILFGIISVPVYVMFLVTLFVKRNHPDINFPFFKLMFSLGIMDLVFYGPALFERYNNFTAGDTLLRIVYTSLGHSSVAVNKAARIGLGNAQPLTVLCMVILRMMAVKFPITFGKVWTNKRTKLYILIIWIFALALAFPLLTGVAETGLYVRDLQAPPNATFPWVRFDNERVNDTKQQLYTIIVSKTVVSVYFLVSATNGTVVLIGICVSQILVLIAVRDMKSSGHESAAQSETIMQVKKMAKVTRTLAFLVLLVLLYPLIDLILSFSNMYLNEDITACFNLIATDLFCLCNPWITLYHSKKVRKLFRATYCGMNGISMATTVAVAPPQ